MMMLLTGEVGKSEGSTDGRNRGEGDGQGAGEDPHLVVRIIVSILTMPSSKNNREPYWEEDDEQAEEKVGGVLDQVRVEQGIF